MVTLMPGVSTPEARIVNPIEPNDEDHDRRHRKGESRTWLRFGWFRRDLRVLFHSVKTNAFTATYAMPAISQQTTIFCKNIYNEVWLQAGGIEKGCGVFLCKEKH